MKKMRRTDFKQFRRTLPVLLLILLASLFLTCRSHAFLTGPNLRNLFMKSAAAQVMACGVTFLLTAGEFDLSGGAVIALSGFLGASLIVRFDLPVIPAVILILALGALLGAGTGWLVARLRMPSLLTTLALMQIIRGLVLRLSSGTTVSGLSAGFRWLGTAVLPGGIPAAALLALALTLFLQAVLRRTVFGYHVRAIGENAEIADASGIPVEKLLRRLYLLAGIFYGLSAWILAGRVGAVSSSLADGQEMTVLAGILIGGCSLSGGTGSFFGSYLGILFLTIVDNGVNLLNVSSYWVQSLQGVIILAAVMGDTLPRYRRRKEELE